MERARIPSETTVSAATILFCDIVGFSKKPTAEQRRLVEGLTGEIIYELRLLLCPPFDTPGVVALPTGDGAALAFIHRPNQPWDRDTIFRLIVRLQQWAFHEKGVKLRVGVHVGAIEVISDVNGRPNVCGDTINYGQRVMDAANPRQVLFSEAAFREYIGTTGQAIASDAVPPDLGAGFEGPIEVFAKHGVQILVFKMTLTPETEYWSNTDPIAKHLMLVSLASLPKEIRDFGARLDSAEQVAFVELTGDRLLPQLRDETVKLLPELKRLWVFMPDPASYERLTVVPPLPGAEQVRNCVGEWRDYLSGLRAKIPSLT